MRYVVDEFSEADRTDRFTVEEKHDGFGLVACAWVTEKWARRIAAALNFHEAHKRGEL